MIVIDGSEGEGGGQVLRNALALSLITGQPFRIENIRGKRSRPGVMRQHVTAVEAACRIGGAECEELAVGASTLTFTPGKAAPGEHLFAVGTAGSTSLVLQTILPVLMLADRPSKLRLEGGTHNMLAPPFEFVDRCFLPIVNRMGPRVTARLVRHGFYPAGGGCVEVEIEPATSLARVELIERGALLGADGEAAIAGLPGDIAVREIAAVRKVLGWEEEKLRIRQLPEEVGPGNIVMLEARFEHVTEISSGFGKLGVPAQAVGEHAARRMAGYLESTAAVGPYLADQLLLPMALAGGGCFTSVKPSQHARTAADIIAMFLPVAVHFDEKEGGRHLVRVESTGQA